MCLPQEKNNLIFDVKASKGQDKNPEVINRLIFKHNLSLYFMSEMWNYFFVFLIFLFYCNLAELLIFLSCNIVYVFLFNEQ